MEIRPSAEAVVARPQESVLATNKVLRNTYFLLALTLMFSAVTAGAAIVTKTPPLPWWMTLIGYFGLLFLTTRLATSAWGLVSVFALTGFMGFTLGPIISIYAGLPGGNEIVMTAMGAHRTWQM